jgi:hypothetical protein
MPKNKKPESKDPKDHKTKGEGENNPKNPQKVKETEKVEWPTRP